MPIIWWWEAKLENSNKEVSQRQLGKQQAVVQELKFGGQVSERESELAYHTSSQTLSASDSEQRE